jgi:hypothetical protein
MGPNSGAIQATPIQLPVMFVRERHGAAVASLLYCTVPKVIVGNALVGGGGVLHHTLSVCEECYIH